MGVPIRACLRRAMSICSCGDVQRLQCGGLDIVVAADSEGAAISRPQITAKFEPSNFGRKHAKDVDEDIENLWAVKCGENSRLYNGSKFRLGGWRFEEGMWELKLGLTCYKALCGTNLAHSHRLIQDRGLRDYGDPQAYMSDPVGVGLLAITNDGCLVVSRRAAWTGEYPGALDRPGGHPEPDHVFHHDGSLLESLRGRDVHDAVMDEVWWSAVAEAEAEVGIKRHQVSEVRWLGLDLNMEAGGRPSFEFLAWLKVSSSEVREEYQLGRQAEADETRCLHLVQPSTLAVLPDHLPHTAEKGEADAAGETMRTSETNASPGRKTNRTSSQESNQVGEAAKEAAWLVKEATPALRAALSLAFLHNLLP